MFKFSKFLMVGLVLSLAACSGVVINSPAPVEEEVPAAVVEEVASQEPAVVEAVAVEEEPVVVEAAVAEVEAAVSEETEAATIDQNEAMETEMTEADALVEAETTGEADALMEAETMSEAVGEAAPSPSPEQLKLLSQMQVIGQPPELNNEVWLNSDPLRLAELHGKVVVIEFWTFG